MDDSKPESTHTFGDYAYDALYVAGIGGGLIALFFLVYDVVTRGQPLFTPTLIGSVLFDRVSADAVQAVDMMAVAKYSIVHFIVFSLLGAGITYVTHRLEVQAQHSLVAFALVFVILEGGFWLTASLALPGVMGEIGPLAVAAANLIAAVGITLFLVFTHQPELWSRIRRALRLA